jgi:hypothetical protein
MRITFYVPEKDRETVEKFRNICAETGQSVSDTLTKFMGEIVTVTKLNEEIDAEAPNKDA